LHALKTLTLKFFIVTTLVVLSWNNTVFAVDCPATTEFGPGWHLVTLPCDPYDKTPSVVFASPFEEVVGIQDGKYIFSGDMVEDVDTGIAYWIHFEATTTVTIQGSKLTNPTIEGQLEPGWNMIGTPFDISSWDDTEIGGTATGDSELVLTPLYYYDVVQEKFVEAGQLDPWKGYFIKIGGTEPVSIIVPNGGTIIPKGEIQGIVQLQGLDDHSGITVHIEPSANPSGAFDLVTTSNGSFSRSNLATGSYSVTASYTGFNSASTDTAVFEYFTTDLGTMTLTDTSAPAISSLSPSNGSTVTTATPTISATFSDTGSGVDTSAVTITVGGSDVTSSANVTASGFSYVPSPGLSNGDVTVNVSISDYAGNPDSDSSTFTVNVSGGDLPHQPTNVQATPCTYGQHTLMCVSWTAPSDPDVTGYNVYIYHQSEEFDSPYNGDRVVRVAKYTLGGLTPGEQYGIEVTSVVEDGGLIVSESQHTDRADQSTVANAGNQAVISVRAIKEEDQGYAGRVAMRSGGDLLRGLIEVASAPAQIKLADETVVATGTTDDFGWVEFSGLAETEYDMVVTDDGGTPEDPDDDIFIDKKEIDAKAEAPVVISNAYLSKDGTGEYCGDGIVNRCEQCDDGNRDDGDGCSWVCERETPGVHGGAICEDETWLSADSPHVVVDDVLVRGFDDPVLTIEAGSTIEFDPGTALVIGDKPDNDGGLIADGTSGAITFTSGSGSPAAGDWRGIIFNKRALSTSVLDNVTIEYAGGGGALRRQRFRDEHSHRPRLLPGTRVPTLCALSPVRQHPDGQRRRRDQGRRRQLGYRGHLAQLWNPLRNPRARRVLGRHNLRR